MSYESISFFLDSFLYLSFYSFSFSRHFYISMATSGNGSFKSMPKQMSDSWIVIDEQDESDFVVIDEEQANGQTPIPLIPSPKPSPQSKRPLGQNNNKPTNMAQPSSGVKQNKKRKWKVLYSLPSTGVKANVDDSNLDSFVMDQHAQLLDKRDLFSNQQRIVKVK